MSFLVILTGNNIEERGVKALSKALKSNTTLTELNLGSEDKRKHTKDIYQQITLFHSFHINSE